MTGTRTRVLVEVALTVALSAVLHYVKLWQMPFGGSLSLEMLPILVLALRRGVVPGIIAGVLFGFVDLLMEPYILHWAQVALDYPVAFGAVGLGGLLSPAWRRAVATGTATLSRTAAWIVPVAVAIGAAGRYVSHFVSGVIFFATAGLGGPLANGQSAFMSVAAFRTVAVYSALYNLYVPISALACGVAMIVLLPTLEKAVPAR
jgi:thiamine transporter